MKNDDENTQAGSDCQERLVRHLMDKVKRITGCEDIETERMTATGVKAIYDMEAHRIKSRALLEAALKAGLECAINRPADTSHHQEVIQSAMDFFVPNAESCAARELNRRNKMPEYQNTTVGQPQVGSDALFASIAALLESRPECLERVTEQVRAIHDKLIEWGWKTVDRDDLERATIQYSRACGVHECCEWLPFDVMPNWEDDLYCLLMAEDPDRWMACINENRPVWELVETLRSEANADVDLPPRTSPQNKQDAYGG